MAQLGKLVFAIKDSAGNALSGVSVEVRKQGAQINGLHAGATTVFTVDDPGAIVAGDNVKLDTGSITRSVSSITATTVTVGGAGFNDAADDSRLTDTTLPTIYNDAIGNETKSNPLTTDAAGEAFCWVVGGKYDVLVSGGGATTKLYTDQTAVGGEKSQSTIYSGTAWHLDSLRALAATDEALVVSENNDGTDLFKVMGDGEIQAGVAGATHTLTGTLTVSSATTLQSTLAVTGASTTTGITNTGTLISSDKVTVQANGIDVTGTSTFNSSSVTGVTTLTRQRAAESVVQTLTDLSTTPSVATGTVFAENNSGATSITNFTSGAVGQVIHIIFNTANTTIVDGATIQLAGGANFVGSSNDVLTLVQWLGTWYEVSRSVN